MKKRGDFIPPAPTWLPGYAPHQYPPPVFRPYFSGSAPRGYPPPGGGGYGGPTRGVYPSTFQQPMTANEVPVGQCFLRASAAFPITVRPTSGNVGMQPTRQGSAEVESRAASSTSGADVTTLSRKVRKQQKEIDDVKRRVNTQRAATAESRASASESGRRVRPPSKLKEAAIRRVEKTTSKPHTDMPTNGSDSTCTKADKSEARKTIQVKYFIKSESPQEKVREASNGESQTCKIGDSRETRNAETNTEFPSKEGEILKELLEDPILMNIMCSKFPRELHELLIG